MDAKFLFKTENDERLYTEMARDLPIIDFHNHVAVADLQADRRFEDLSALWLAPDPYKHRLMRIGGVSEHLITRDDANEALRSPEFSANGILSRFSVEYHSPVAGLTDDLSVFENTNAAPSLRGDNLLSPYRALYGTLAQKTGLTVTHTAFYSDAVCVLLNAFDKAGCHRLPERERVSHH